MPGISKRGINPEESMNMATQTNNADDFQCVDDPFDLNQITILDDKKDEEHNYSNNSLSSQSEIKVNNEDKKILSDSFLQMLDSKEDLNTNNGSLIKKKEPEVVSSPTVTDENQINEIKEEPKTFDNKCLIKYTTLTWMTIFKSIIVTIFYNKPKAIVKDIVRPSKRLKLNWLGVRDCITWYTFVDGYRMMLDNIMKFLKYEFLYFVYWLICLPFILCLKPIKFVLRPFKGLSKDDWFKIIVVVLLVSILCYNISMEYRTNQKIKQLKDRVEYKFNMLELKQSQFASSMIKLSENEKKDMLNPNCFVDKIISAAGGIVKNIKESLSKPIEALAFYKKEKENTVYRHSYKDEVNQRKKENMDTTYRYKYPKNSEEKKTIEVSIDNEDDYDETDDFDQDDQNDYDEEPYRFKEWFKKMSEKTMDLGKKAANGFASGVGKAAGKIEKSEKRFREKVRNWYKNRID